MTEQEEFEFRHRLEQEQAAAPRMAAPKLVAPTSMPEAAPNYLEDSNWLQRGLIGAGKATNDLLLGVGFSPEGAIGKHIVVDPVPEADKQLMSDPAGLIGNIGGQAGLMYVGGKALQGAGKAVGAARGVGALGQAAGRGIEAAGNAVIAPSSYKQAASVGGVWGALSQPGDLVDRVENAGIGAIGGSAGLALGRGLGKIAGSIKSALTPTGDMQAEITARLASSGIDFNALPREAQKQIIKIGKRSVEDLDVLDEKQLARLADFNSLGITPTRGWVTRDAKDWWLENNLNTVDDQIAARFKDANQKLVQGVTKDAGSASDYQMGKKLEETITGYDSALKSKADALYNQARATAGRDIPLDPHQFVNRASIDLDQQMLGAKLPKDTLLWFKRVTGGKEPFDMGTALQRLQAINGRIYSTTDPAEAKALGIVKNHLIDVIDNGEAAAATLRPNPGVQPQGNRVFTQPGFGSDRISGPSNRLSGPQSTELIPFNGELVPTGGRDAGYTGIAEAFRAARSAAADRFRFQESNPLVEKVLKGRYTPERLPEIISSMRVDDLNSLAKVEAERGVPMLSSLRDAAKAYIRDSSTLQGETGGTFTTRGLRTALDKIGPEKGEVLFGEKGWDDYQRILRAAGNINNAPIKPAGSATAANMMRMLQQIPLPGVPKAINIAITGLGKFKQMSDVGAALNSGSGLLTPMPVQKAASKLPLLTTPGLLGVSE